ncbi:MAG: lycopene cyclase [Halomonadaceae bacterium]|nr:MAG: lycopene cyclase [Halomonadaceae bacterium]
MAGAGLTGLSLACWLLDLATQRRQPLPRILMLEPRSHYSNDRTWCFWDRQPQPFRHCIRQRWPRWAVQQGQQRQQQQGDHAPYAMLPAEDLYREALARINREPAITLKQGVTVQQLLEQPQQVQVVTSDGHFSSHAVIDTRPPAREAMAEEQGLWQVFTGLELALPDHGFEADCALLMDFQPGVGDTRFVYVLPLGPDHLLVEWTAFQPHLSAPALSADFDHWLNIHLGTGYRVLRQEQGALPMMPLRPRSATAPVSRRIVTAGTAAGWLRPATGYLFATCQRGARALAEQVLDAHRSGVWELPGWQPRSALLNWMDRVFLRALQRHPEQAPQWFLRLFGGTSPERLSRFLSDQPGLLDILAIMTALPPWPFLQSALSRPHPRLPATGSPKP